MEPRNSYRSVFISDLHLGAVGGKSRAVLHFLDQTQCDHLYLVGDIIDGWVGRKVRKWTPEHMQVVRELLDKANEGCTVRYTPGNHDAFMRRLNGTQWGNVHIAHSFCHTLLDGRDLLVVHGDLFDRTVTRFPMIAFIGAWLHEIISVMNSKVNKQLGEQGKRPIDVASAIKRGVKRFIGRKTNYEATIVQFAKENGFDGVVCGHVHRPTIDTADDGMLYVNTGDWVENCTAVVEHHDGRLEILKLCIDLHDSVVLPGTLQREVSTP